ncbi:MAG: PAS domain-containing protein [Hydrogenophaga sp.]|uniref:PAS domain-containing protein n=1 Tax=Hydrogenophaga sp. TaxID=1904254 RepID=UPI001DDFBAE5|nr:PAS domain-containing protein [Hydrogenophaga sp.]MBX3611066.1 PAS domain-containing protein [Hydrogenophaga sp.]
METEASRPSSHPVDATDALPFRAFFLALPVAAAISRRVDGRLIEVNPAWEALTGDSRAEAIGRTTTELGHWRGLDRETFLAHIPGEIPPTRLHFHGGVAHLVRMHVAVYGEGHEQLLLVQMIEAEREVEAIQAREQSEQALWQANIELQQRVELHQIIEKTARVGHWTNAENDQEVIWSDGLYAITGMTPHDRMTRNDGRSGIHPDDMPTWLRLRKALDGEEMVFRWTRPDGEMRYMRTRMGQTTVKGNPQTDFGVLQDITSEREISNRLSEQLKLLQNIAARVPGVIYQAVLGADGVSRITYASEAVRDLFGVEPEALTSDAAYLFDILHPKDKPLVMVALARSAEDLVPWRQTYRVVLPERGVRWLSTEALPAREADGSVVWHGFSTDVTLEQEERQRQARITRMLAAISQAQSHFIEGNDQRLAFDGLLAAFLSVTGSGYGFLAEVLYDDEGAPYLRTRAITDISWDEASRNFYQLHRDKGMEFRNLNTLFGHALRSREPVIANDPANDWRSGGMPGEHPDLDAFLGIPLSVGDRLVAMVGLANQPGGYSDADVAFLEPLLGSLRQLVVASRAQEEQLRTRAQLEDTSALLADKSQALRLTLDSISQGLVKIEADGRIGIYNTRFLELLDLPEEVVSNHPQHDDVIRFQTERGDFGPDLTWVDSHAREYISLRPDAQMPADFLRRTRQGRTLEIRTFQFPDGGIVRTYADVSSYIAAQDALRDERQRLAWVLEATRPGIWETNLSDRTMVVNERWAEMIGYTLDELQPISYDTWYSRVHPDDRAMAIRLRERHAAGELPYYDCDIRMRHKDGHWVWVNTRGRVHSRDEHDRALYMSGTHLDVSDRVAAQEQIRALNASLEQRVSERTAQLERSMRDMEAISYSIAHDLRAPLRSVNGFAQVVAEEEMERLSPQGREMFQRISRSARNMGQMITDMLELLRVVQVELEPRPVDMVALAHAVAEALGPQAPNARIDVGEMPLAMGDATLLRQVLSNLVDNAIKYSRQSAAPRVVVGYDAAVRAYFVRDNGIGFDMTRAAKLFGLFQRLHAQTDVPGMGVGLAIVSRIVERHGGRVWAESAPGQGATFWFSLPRA